MRPHASSPAQAPVIPATEAFVEAGRVHTTTVRRAVGGDCAGDVDWRPVGKTGTIEIGIWLPPAHRGHGVGTEAQRQLVEYLFATSPVHRLQAGTEAGNIAEQRALERVGFQREGVLRGMYFRDGEYRDSVMYGLLRHEWTRR